MKNFHSTVLTLATRHLLTSTLEWCGLDPICTKYISAMFFSLLFHIGLAIFTVSTVFIEPMHVTTFSVCWAINGANSFWVKAAFTAAACYLSAEMLLSLHSWCQQGVPSSVSRTPSYINPERCQDTHSFKKAKQKHKRYKEIHTQSYCQSAALFESHDRHLHK